MKKQITEKQWQELDDIDGIDLSMSLTEDLKEDEAPDLPNTGDLIDFLGDDLVGFWRGEDMIGWEVDLINEQAFIEEELVDALWMATVYKLKQKDGKA